MVGLDPQQGDESRRDKRTLNCRQKCVEGKEGPQLGSWTCHSELMRCNDAAQDGIFKKSVPVGFV